MGRVQQQKIVSAVIGSLTPSIEEAVMNALMANMATTQTQSSFSSTSTQSDAGFTSTSVSSSSSEQTLITRIIEALTPSITVAVRRALKEKYESQQAALLLQQQQQEAAAFQASQQAQQSSSVSQSELIAQIVAALKPSIAVSVQDALNASRFQQQQQQQQVIQSQVSNAASQQSSSVSSGTLPNIFGESGSAHNVKVETPEFNY